MCAQQEKTKPAMENSLRILTAVINGMRHWSQFKDKVPYLFELFGQLNECCCFLWRHKHFFPSTIKMMLCSSLSDAWLCSHIWSPWSQKLPHARREGSYAVCLLWKCEYEKNKQAKFLLRSKLNKYNLSLSGNSNWLRAKITDTSPDWWLLQSRGQQEQELPRLIRGQVHRCVGNYDRSRDVLTCVSVRPGLPSELRNAQEAVKACDEEMRALVKSLSEVWGQAVWTSEAESWESLVLSLKWYGTVVMGLNLKKKVCGVSQVFDFKGSVIISLLTCLLSVNVLAQMFWCFSIKSISKRLFESIQTLTESEASVCKFWNIFITKKIHRTANIFLG